MSEVREWYSLPISDKKRRLKFFVLFPLSVIVFWLAGGVFWGIFAFVVLMLVLFPFYTKTKYRIEDGKVTVIKPFYTFTRELSYFKRVYRDNFGVFLSPFTKRSFLESFRGLYLMVDSPDLRDKIYDELKKEIEGVQGGNSQ
ncbi:MAG: hypothetical protein ABIL91_01080 [candidate division WOR-3 bacterium]